MYRSSPNPDLGLPSSTSRSQSYDEGGAGGSKATLLDELDKLAPLKTFDAFPKVQPTYQTKSARGGFVTFAIAWACFLLILNDLGEYLYGEADYSFSVDQGIGREVQLNIDMTVAMPCHFLSIDLRDAVGDRVFLSNDFTKDGTDFDTSRASEFQSSTTASLGLNSNSASSIIAQTPRRSSGLLSLFYSSSAATKRPNSLYRKTRKPIPDGPACRVYGSVEVKKVTANLHVTTLGHGYMSYEHTDHGLMNLSHIIHEWSFGPYYPKIAQPLDMSMEISDKSFSIFQYFLTVVPTTYIDASRRRLETNQYSVTDYVRHVEHGQGVPGIFFKFDLDSLALTIEERTTSFYHFLVRLIGVIGGVWTCTGFALRAIARAEREVRRKKKGKGRAREDQGGLLSNLGGGSRRGSAVGGAGF
ncbi:endoplasmic reticulum vesicle transporter-domain-containing protein [Mrakia frigida]|uniref:Erv41p n=1 Tax=Mrakia frigida TaxID=29902 RepID=UPI003FCC1E1F